MGAENKSHRDKCHEFRVRAEGFVESVRERGKCWRRPSDKGGLYGFQQHTGWKPEISFDKTMRDLLEYWRNKVKLGRKFLRR